MLHKKDEENLTNRCGCGEKPNQRLIRFDISPSFLPFGKAGGLQIRRCQGLAVAKRRLRPWRLGSEALRLLQHWGKANLNYFFQGEKYAFSDIGFGFYNDGDGFICIWQWTIRDRISREPEALSSKERKYRAQQEIYFQSPSKLRSYQASWRF
jgi:hypothetical protein